MRSTRAGAPADAPASAASGRSDYVSREEALKLLDVKPATLYTYVSRGWVRSIPSGDSRRHLFLRPDIERLRGRSQAHSGQDARSSAALNWGEPIIKTAITELTPSAPRYRNRSALELADLPFEAVANLLWCGALSDGSPWPVAPLPFDPDVFLQGADIAVPPESVLQTFATVVCALGIKRAEAGDESVIGDARELLQVLVGCCGLLRPGGGYLHPHPNEPLAEALARAFGIAPNPPAVRALNAALVVNADHELGPATFSSRVAASTGARLHACVANGILAHSGDFRDGSAQRMEALLRSGTIRAPSESQLAFVRDHGTELGFNHPLYPRGDPCAWAMLSIARALPKAPPQARHAFRFLDTVQQACHVYPGRVAGLAAMAVALRLPRHAASALWMVSQAAGLVAHVIEQRTMGSSIRPRAQFVPTAGSEGQDRH